MESIVTNRCTEQQRNTELIIPIDIFSEQANNNCMGHIITYRYIWIRYPVYSTYSIGVSKVRRGNECDITY
jgi:hypothetical protein